MAELKSAREGLHSWRNLAVMTVPGAIRLKGVEFLVRERRQFKSFFSRIEADQKTLEYGSSYHAIGIVRGQPGGDFDQAVPHPQVPDSEGTRQTDPGFRRLSAAEAANQRGAHIVQAKLFRGF